MGKMREIPTRPARKKSEAAATGKKVQLGPEQQARLDAFRASVKQQEDQWNAMTPEQQHEEIEAWNRVKAQMNADRAGYRQLFVDD